MRKYAELWKRLAANETVTIICPARGKNAVRAGIYNEKYRHQVAREATELPGFGRIKIETEELPQGKLRLTISIPFSGDNL